MTDLILRDGERIDDVNESIRLIQKTKGLTFGSDAYLLAAYMKSSKRATAAELGGGTGIISLIAAAREKFSKIYVLEVQEEFSELCERNASLNSLSDKINPICADVRGANASTLGGEVDVVFSNPPYMKADSGKRNEHDEKFIARHEVCGDISDFCAAARRLLKFGGLFYCVYRPDRLTDLFAALRENSLEVKNMTFVSSDSKTAPSMVLIEAKKGAAPGMKISPPLFLNCEDEDRSGARKLSPDAEWIYENCSFENFLKGSVK